MINIPHIVICKYCKEKFDRDKEPYCSVGSRRYAHAKCAIEEYKLHPDQPIPEIIDPTLIVECAYCKKKFNKNEEEYVQNGRKFYHKDCYDKKMSELTDEEKLNIYIMKKFEMDYVLPVIQRQIKNYLKQYKYTHSGIYRTLFYFWEVKNNKLEKSQHKMGISFVPFYYETAYNYYYSIWEAQQKQEKIITSGELEQYLAKTVEIKIKSPKRQDRKRKLFSFLDEEGD